MKTAELKQFSKTPEFSALILMILLILVNMLLQDNFFSGNILRGIINSFAPLILLAMGQAIILISGGLDLSIGNATSLINCILATVMIEGSPGSAWLAIFLGMFACAAMGFINGFATGVLRLSPMIVTFCTSSIWLGIAEFIRPTAGGFVHNWFRGFYNLARVEGMPRSLVNLGNFIPPALVLIIIGVITWAIIKRTKLGRYIYATGGNEENAYATGIKTQWVIVAANIVAYVFVFLAAVFLTAQSKSGDAYLAGSITLSTLAAAVIGGVSLAGGRGNVYFAIVGAIILQIVMKIVFFAGVSGVYQELVRGVVIILATASSLLYNFNGKLKEVK